MIQRSLTDYFRTRPGWASFWEKASICGLGVDVKCDEVTFHPIVTIKAVVHKAEVGGYWAEVPALPGCVTQAENMEDLRSNLREAIEGWLEAGNSELPGDHEGEILELAV